MKKIVLFFALVLAASAAQAQIVHSEFKVGYGWYSSNQMIHQYTDMQTALDIPVDGEIVDGHERGTGAITATYMFEILNRVKLGATFAYERLEKDFHFLSQGLPMTMNTKNDFYVVAADLQFRYLQIPSNVLSLYWSVSLGAVFYNQKMSEPTWGERKFDETRLAYHVVPLGLNIGMRTFGAFAEVGFGYKGLFRTGLYFRF